jgi:hypothetical protein
MRKLVFAALAGVFMLSSGFTPADKPENLEGIDENLIISEIIDAESNSEFEDKICRYRFVNSEGESLTVIDIVVDSRDNCRRPGLMAAANFEYEAGKYVGQY